MTRFDLVSSSALYSCARCGGRKSTAEPALCPACVLETAPRPARAARTAPMPRKARVRGLWLLAAGALTAAVGVLAMGTSLIGLLLGPMAVVLGGVLAVVGATVLVRAWLAAQAAPPRR